MSCYELHVLLLSPFSLLTSHLATKFLLVIKFVLYFQVVPIIKSLTSYQVNTASLNSLSAIIFHPLLFFSLCRQVDISAIYLVSPLVLFFCCHLPHAVKFSPSPSWSIPVVKFTVFTIILLLLLSYLINDPFGGASCAYQAGTRQAGKLRGNLSFGTLFMQRYRE